MLYDSKLVFLKLPTSAADLEKLGINFGCTFETCVS